MALVPARFLIPMRAVEPPPSSALSSASVCSVAGAYPHFSLFFFHPPSHRSSFSVSASILEAQNFRTYNQQGRHSQFRRQPDESVPFDDLQTLYAEEKGHVPRPHRDLNGRGRPATRGDGNSSRKMWEPSRYSPWKKNGGQVKSIYTKPLGPEGTQDVSSWTSHAEDEASEGSLQQRTIDDRKSRNLGSNTERKSFARQSNAYGESGWQKQVNLVKQDLQGLDAWRQHDPLDNGFPRERGRYYEKMDNPALHPQGQYNGETGKEKLNSQRVASPKNLWSSSTDFGEKLGESHPGSISHSSNDVMELQQPIENSFSMQSAINQGSWQEEQPEEEAKAEFQGDPEPENNSFRGVSPISRIMQRLRNVDDRVPQLHARAVVQSRHELADFLDLPSAREYLSDRSVRQPLVEQSEKGPVDTRFPWEKEKEAEDEDSTLARARRLKPLSTAELTIPGPELRRLRILALHLKQRVKLGKHGVTKDLVSSILKRFETCEVVKVKCEGPPAGNMKKTLETLEQKTGGLVIWKAGSAAVIYRGPDYGQPVAEIVDDLLAKKYQSMLSVDRPQEVSSSASLKPTTAGDGILKEGNLDSFDNMEHATGQLNQGASLDDASQHLDSAASLDTTGKQTASRKRSRTSGPEFDKLEEYCMEVEDILKDLGARYEEWTGGKPVPVDADLLPFTIPNYTPPYRLLPFGTRPTVGNTLATHLRRLSQPLSPHFVIGRDRGLQGLASAMVKLWEKSEIAKIGIKRGVLNTNHERIAEDLKQLTGGFYLCRDKHSMTFYRGKDFLPPKVAAALAERQTRAQDLQVEEERTRADGSINVSRSVGNSASVPSWVHLIDPDEQIRLKKEAARARRVQVVAYLERKLKMALQKKEKAGKELGKVEELLKPVAPSDDKETLTSEERFMLKKLGLKMRAFLLVGRRGVFAGVVQNMHLHWKHRELVKIIIKERDPVQLQETARMLEAESGGILISVEPTSKGFAIVVYRGKNYKRPPELRPPNLLTKRLALQRSVEKQRRESLSRHIQALEEEIVHLRAGLTKMKMQENNDDSVSSEDRHDPHDTLTHDALSESQTYQLGRISQSGSQGSTTAREISSKEDLYEDDDRPTVSKVSRRKLENMCEIGPIFRAVRLSKTERHALRREVLHMRKAAQFLVGRSNPMSTIAKAIRLHFLDHAFAKIGVSYRPRGTSLQAIVEELEDLTGGTAYAQDDFKVILYRGWQKGEDMPLEGLYDVLSPEQCDILEEDEDRVDEFNTEDEDGKFETKTDNSMVEAKNHKDESKEDGDVKDKGMWQWDTVSDEDDEDLDDVDDVDELRPENALARQLETSDDEDTDWDLCWDRFSDDHVESSDADEGDDTELTILVNGNAGDEDDNDGESDDSDRLLSPSASKDHGSEGDTALVNCKHVQSTTLTNFEHSSILSFERAVEVKNESLLEGANDGAGEDLGLNFDLDEDV